MPAADDSDGLWVTLSELAEIKGISRQATSKRLKRLAADGLIEVREAPDNTKSVRLSEWDTATNEWTDPSRLVGRSAKVKPPSNYTAELTRKARYDADLKEIELRRRQSELLEAKDVEKAMTGCAESIVRAIGQLSTRAEEIVAAVGQRGVAGAREVLKTVERDLRASIARSMKGLAASEEEDETLDRGPIVTG
jgi:DNA-binding MarR family transcriptional regulator